MKILFFGDSITEANRDKGDPSSLGDGYVYILHEKLKNLYEDIHFEFVNCGVSHSRIADLEVLAEKEVRERRPDIAVVLIGINDVWSRSGMDVTFEEESFAAAYERTLAEIKDGKAKLIVVEPFLFNVPDKKRFRKNFDCMVSCIRKAAEKYADAFVPLDEMFRGVSQSVGIAAYSLDGVHPTHRAARLIADNIIKKIKLFL